MECQNEGWKKICSVLPKRLSAPLEKYAQALSGDAREIVLRLDRPLVIETARRRCYLTENRCLVSSLSDQPLLTVTADDIKSTFLKICSYSVHSFQHEINEGYLTLDGGCRVGLCGSAVTDGEKIVNIRDISSLSFRLMRELKGCADDLLSGVDPMKGVLIAGEPASGKTTLIRDIARTLSYQYKVSLIDERRELSASKDGRSQNDVGLCDVFVSYPKKTALTHALRSMAPQIIVCDELSGMDDLVAVRECGRCGASLIASIHSGDLSSEPVRRLLSTGAFSYTVLLKGREEAGSIREIVGTGAAE